LIIEKLVANKVADADHSAAENALIGVAGDGALQLKIGAIAVGVSLT
jgi:hypothetical protein